MNKNDKKFLNIFLIICGSFLLSIIGISIYLNNSNEKKYQKAQEYFDSEKFSEAQELFLELGEYKDSVDLGKKAKECAQNIAEKVKIYDEAQDDFSKGKYENALNKFESIADFNDSADKIKETKYKLAIQYYNNEDYDKSKKFFEELREYDNIDFYLKKLLKDYKSIDSYLDEIEIKKLNQLKEDIYKKACNLLDEKKYKEALEKFNSILDYSDSQKHADECKKFLYTTISAGLHFSAAVTSEGKGICTNKIYELHDWNNLVSISCLGTMIIGLNENGTVQYEGHENGENSRDVDVANVSEWKDIVQISAGQQHLVGLTDDGKVLTSGYEGNNLKDVLNWTDICFITTGWMNTVGLDTNGNIHIAGYKSQELLKEIKATENWNDIVLISAGGGDSERNKKGHIVGLRKDGTVVAIGDNDYNQCDVGNWDNIIAISAGDYHTVGLKKDGTVVTTRPLEKQMKKLSSDSPFRVDDWKGIIAISAGRGFTLGQKSDGSVISTGNSDDFKKPKEDDPTWEKIKMYDAWNNMTEIQ